ncbi:MAG TPA: DUF4416 family protein [Nitrospirota bacterium]|nr:DUF4416 family protein [Nitrospirota bacterium]
MGEAHTPFPVKLFIGMLTAREQLFASCMQRLSDEFGPVEHESPSWSWDASDYYREELGDGIKRKFIFFQQRIDPGLLPEIKEYSNSLERLFSEKGQNDKPLRKINIDPGYLTEAKVVLATTKDYSHRLYIGRGIYAEVTLRYHSRERSFLPHEFTFPDFRRESYLALFNSMRDSLRRDLKR